MLDLSRPSVEIAPLLLGAVVHGRGVSVRLTEVEAYLGEVDPGSHAFRGQTRRNAVMYGPAGHL
ncbi:MAG: DNA-3-methyladenine glycosylase, partial [Pseudolysinimonas sp.]